MIKLLGYREKIALTEENGQTKLRAMLSDGQWKEGPPVSGVEQVRKAMNDCGLVPYDGADFSTVADLESFLLDSANPRTNYSVQQTEGEQVPWVRFNCFENPTLAEVIQTARKEFHGIPDDQLEITGTVPETVTIRVVGVREDEKLMADTIRKCGIT